MFCKSKTSLSLLANFTEFLSDISISTCIQLDAWTRNKVVTRTKLQQVGMKYTDFSFETKIKDNTIIYDMR